MNRMRVAIQILPDVSGTPPAPVVMENPTMDQVMLEMVSAALKQYPTNKMAANALGVSVRTLYTFRQRIKSRMEILDGV